MKVVIVDNKIPHISPAIETTCQRGGVCGRQLFGPRISSANADAFNYTYLNPLQQRVTGRKQWSLEATATIGFDHIDIGVLQREGNYLDQCTGMQPSLGCPIHRVGPFVIGKEKGLELKDDSGNCGSAGNVGNHRDRCQKAGPESAAFLNDLPRQEKEEKQPLFVLATISRGMWCDYVSTYPLYNEGAYKT